MIDAERACRELAPAIWPGAEVLHTQEQAEGFGYWVAVTVDSLPGGGRCDAAVATERDAAAAWADLRDQLLRLAAPAVSRHEVLAARAEEQARTEREHAGRIHAALAAVRLRAMAETVQTSAVGEASE